MREFPKSPSHSLPTIAWEARKNIQKTHRSKILCFGCMQYMEKQFGRWNATHLLHDLKDIKSKILCSGWIQDMEKRFGRQIECKTLAS